MTKLTALTTMCADYFEESGDIVPGGEALNFAAAASVYKNASVSIIGAIGDDSCGEKILEVITSKGIDKTCLHIVKDGRTACNRIFLTKDGDRYFKDNSWDGGADNEFVLSERDIEKLAASDIVYTHYWCPNFARIAELKASCGFKLAVDFDVIRDLALLEKNAVLTDFFFISGEESILPFFRSLSEKYPAIFNITLAEKGSVTYQNGSEYRIKAVPVDGAVDTTGCGDSYHAGFICEYAESGSIARAMNEGGKAAAKILSHIGGINM